MSKSKVIYISSGAILNCAYAKRKGSLKRWIMNLQAKIFARRFSEYLNHTAVIENEQGSILIWEASIKAGVRPIALRLYPDDVFIIITESSFPGHGMTRIKSQASVDYDFRSWFTYLKFLITRRWKGDDEEKEFSEKWFCSELVDWANELTPTPFQSTPNHVFEATKNNELWRGSMSEFKRLIANKKIVINE